jgi:hypothetical protein
VGQLKDRYREVFGEDSRSNHKQFLFRRIAWRIQANVEGGLSERARRRALEIANDADLRIRAPKNFLKEALDETRTVESRISSTTDPRLPLPGTLLVRRFQGKDVVIRVREDGFECDGNRDEMQKRALATESAGTGYNVNSTGTYNCDVWSLHKDVDDQIRSNSDSPLAPDRDATIFLTQKALIRRENQWVTKFFGTGIWTNNVTGQATADSTHVIYWDSGNYPNGNPITDIRHAKTQMRLSSGGFAPNIFVVSRPVFDKLVDHPDFIDRTKYGQTAPNPAVATRQIMAEILELEDVLVIDAVYNTAAEGAAESNAFIGGMSAALFYRPKNAGLMTPSAGYVFNWTGLIGTTGGAGVRIKTFRMEHLASDRVEIDSAFDMRLVSPDLGFFSIT